MLHNHRSGMLAMKLMLMLMPMSMTVVRLAISVRLVRLVLLVRLSLDVLEHMRYTQALAPASWQQMQVGVSPIQVLDLHDRVTLSELVVDLLSL
jgi:hypothetical protein